jgi:hypothetical protein
VKKTVPNIAVDDVVVFNDDCNHNVFKVERIGNDRRMKDRVVWIRDLYEHSAPRVKVQSRKLRKLNQTEKVAVFNGKLHLIAGNSSAKNRTESNS